MMAALQRVQTLGREFRLTDFSQRPAVDAFLAQMQQDFRASFPSTTPAPSAAPPPLNSDADWDCWH
jgi:hypothetical protein